MEVEKLKAENHLLKEKMKPIVEKYKQQKEEIHLLCGNTHLTDYVHKLENEKQILGSQVSHLQDENKRLQEQIDSLSSRNTSDGVWIEKEREEQRRRVSILQHDMEEKDKSLQREVEGLHAIIVQLREEIKSRDHDAQSLSLSIAFKDSAAKEMEATNRSLAKELERIGEASEREISILKGTIEDLQGRASSLSDSLVEQKQLRDENIQTINMLRVIEHSKSEEIRSKEEENSRMYEKLVSIEDRERVVIERCEELERSIRSYESEIKTLHSVQTSLNATIQLQADTIEDKRGEITNLHREREVEEAVKSRLHRDINDFKKIVEDKDFTLVSITGEKIDGVGLRKYAIPIS